MLRFFEHLHQISQGLTLKQHIEQTLGSGTIEQAVKLPQGEDQREWIAVNTVFLFNALSVLYSVLDGELCTDDCCPVMSAGQQYEYLWADGVRVRTPIKLSAPAYINALFDWVEEQLDDPSIFPRGLGTTFSRDFISIVKTILKRLFRVYAHIYHSHFRQIVSLELDPHLNTCFRHFVLFVQEFELVDSKELAPLRELIDGILSSASHQ